MWLSSDSCSLDSLPLLSISIWTACKNGDFRECWDADVIPERSEPSALKFVLLSHEFSLACLLFAWASHRFHFTLVHWLGFSLFFLGPIHKHTKSFWGQVLFLICTLQCSELFEIKTAYLGQALRYPRKYFHSFAPFISSSKQKQKQSLHKHTHTCVHWTSVMEATNTQFRLVWFWQFVLLHSTRTYNMPPELVTVCSTQFIPWHLPRTSTTQKKVLLSTPPSASPPSCRSDPPLRIPRLPDTKNSEQTR